MTNSETLYANLRAHIESHCSLLYLVTLQEKQAGLRLSDCQVKPDLWPGKIPSVYTP